MERTDALIFFCRYPEPGRVKTRLAASLGGAVTARLYACFLIDVSGAAAKSGAKVFVFHTPPSGGEEHLKPLLNGRFTYITQRGKDLGARMAAAFSRVFRGGFERAVLIGSDVPDLGADTLKSAFSALRGHKAVIGPAHDGGYYLIGFRRGACSPDIFGGIGWGGPEVFSGTMERLKKAGITPFVLETRRDIDTLDDLRAFYARNRGHRRHHLRTMRAVQLNKAEILGAKK